jgi:pyruvate/2-oxoglutarate dehydrogenase complex dihydrolipoamide dehydrogenase (E3) component
MRQAERYGLDPADPRPPIRRILERVERKIATVAPNDSVERYEGLGVEVVRGRGRLVDPWTVAIRLADGGERRLTGRGIVLATGAEPVLPDLPGREEVPLLTSETVWGWLRRCPLDQPRLVVLGGGPIGCELAQALAQLGLPVIQVQRDDRLLPREDDEVAAAVRRGLEADGVTLWMETQVLGFSRQEDGTTLVRLRNRQGEAAIACDGVLCALGRRARLEGYGLEELGIPTEGTITTDDHLQTIYPNITAAGDVAGPFQFTHAASHQAGSAVLNALFGDLVRFRSDHRVMPRTTFTDPEVATVGLTEAEAAERGTAVEVTRFPLEDLDRAIVAEAREGFVKVLTPPGRDTILGATVVGERAGEVLAELVLAMRWGLGLGKVFNTVHAYPTFTEANRSVAGAWRRNHAPRRLLDLLERFHAWRRGG